MSWKTPFNYTEYLQDVEPYATFNKKYSKNVLQYYEDPEDDWFHYVVTRVKKTGAIDHVSMIIQKDVEAWMSYQGQQGWVKS